MDKVTAKTVTRYYYKKRGYGTRFAAFKRLAKHQLYNEVLGVNRELFDQRIKDGAPYDPEADGKQEELIFADMMRCFGFVCETNYQNEYYIPMRCCPSGFAFCGRKYKAWIATRAKELMKAQDNAKTTVPIL